MNGEEPQISVLTAGRDRPYALGLATALAAAGLRFDFVGSNEVDGPELHQSPRIRFLNLRGDQSVEAGLPRKALRVLTYYARLMHYALTARPRVFHLLWNNKFEGFDRTVLMLYYRLLGKKIMLTAHNINIGARDGADSWWNRRTLRFQYQRCDRIFVHTRRMQEDLIAQFGVDRSKVDLIPFGLNRTVPDTALTPAEARTRLGLAPGDKVLLFFGNIAPYKGLEYLLAAFATLGPADASLQLVIAGRPKGAESYWDGLRAQIDRSPVRDRMRLKIEYVPDAETEVYFKASDVLLLPYTYIYQSGVLALGYGFGLPVIAADVGSLKEDVVAGRTGLLFEARSSAALAGAIREFFESALYHEREQRRREIQDFAAEHHSWSKVADITRAAVEQLTAGPRACS